MERYKTVSKKCYLLQVQGDVGSGSIPRWSTLIFSCIRRLRPFFLVENFAFQYFRGFSENVYFLRNEDCVDIFMGS